MIAHSHFLSAIHLKAISSMMIFDPTLSAISLMLHSPFIPLTFLRSLQAQYR